MSPLVPTSELYADAEKRVYALGAFNTVNLEITRGIHNAAHEEKSPFILAVSKGAITYSGIKNLVCMAKNFNDEYKTLNALHLDHGPDLETAILCKDSGFTSVMFDGSKNPLDENIRLTKQVREALGDPEWPLEGELGRLPGAEDHISVSEREAFFTDPDEAIKFVKESGVNSLAISIGNAHGPYKGEPKLDFELLKEIKKRTGTIIVLHGASGLSDDDLKYAVELGVRKINFDTDLRIAFKKGMLGYLETKPEEIDVRRYFKPAIEAVTEVVRHKMKVLNSSGKHS